MEPKRYTICTKDRKLVVSKVDSQGNYDICLFVASAPKFPGQTWKTVRGVQNALERIRKLNPNGAKNLEAVEVYLNWQSIYQK